jgi:hypothetical protein
MVPPLGAAVGSGAQPEGGAWGLGLDAFSADHSAWRDVRVVADNLGENPSGVLSDVDNHCLNFTITEHHSGYIAHVGTSSQSCSHGRLHFRDNTNNQWIPS